MSRQLALDEATLPDYLRGIGVFGPEAALRIEAAGDGNINWVRRASSPGGRSVVVKQARPALERFPQYRVSTERLVFEARYFEVAGGFDRAGTCPTRLAFQERDRVLVLEDLGDAPRLDHVLSEGGDGEPAARVLAAFLGRVHRGTRTRNLAARFANDAMRRLHGDHIFRLPLEPNDFPLPPATRHRAEQLRRDASLCAVAAEAYQRYLRPQGALVHGDVQAGNVLLAARGPVLLDAEIAHVGDPAFDLGTLLAHLALPAIAWRGQPGEGSPLPPRSAVRTAWAAYREAHGEAELSPFRVVARYAGLEMLRRTVGAARLPAVAEDAAGLAVIEAAVDWILAPPPAPEELTGI